MYTLLSSSVLALDLARHPGGALVADVVDTALALRLEDAQPPPIDLRRAEARVRLRACAAAAPRTADALQGVSRAVQQGLSSPSLPSAAAALRTALLGTLDDLLALLRGHLAGVHPAVVDVVLDRVTAVWTQHAPGAGPSDVQLLTEPWEQLVPVVPPEPPAGPHAAALSDLLEAVARSSQAQWAGLDARHDRRRGSLEWSQQLHEACRAAHDHGRVLDVARWQLSSVRAASSASHGGAASTAGAMMTVVGAVQALAVRDVVDAAVRDALLAPARAVLGTAA